MKVGSTQGLSNFVGIVLSIDIYTVRYLLIAHEYVGPVSISFH